MTADGLITIRSNYGPKETMDRLEAEAKGKGLTVFAHVDHAAGAAAIGLSLDPTHLLIFGNAALPPNRAVSPTASPSTRGASGLLNICCSG